MDPLSDLFIAVLRWLGPHEVEAVFFTLSMFLMGSAAAAALVLFVYGLKLQRDKPQRRPNLRI